MVITHRGHGDTTPPPHSNVTTLHSNVTTLLSDVIPPHRYATPPLRDVTPLRSDTTPLRSDTPLPHHHGTPRTLSPPCLLMP